MLDIASRHSRNDAIALVAQPCNLCMRCQVKSHRFFEEHSEAPIMHEMFIPCQLILNTRDKFVSPSHAVHVMMECLYQP